MATPTTYQRVTTASDYDASVSPIFIRMDGIDDGLSAATFAAGTLTSSMDCLIAVRRDSAANVIIGLYGLGGTLFGECTSGAGYPSYSSGSPSVFVDAQSIGISAGALNSAVAPGPFHIVEYQGLDMSAWTQLSYGNFGGYRLNGGFGGIRLFPSTTDAIRNLARTELAARVGLVL